MSGAQISRPIPKPRNVHFSQITPHNSLLFILTPLPSLPGAKAVCTQFPLMTQVRLLHLLTELLQTPSPSSFGSDPEQLGIGRPTVRRGCCLLVERSGRGTFIILSDEPVAYRLSGSGRCGQRLVCPDRASAGSAVRGEPGAIGIAVAGSASGSMDGGS